MKKFSLFLFSFLLIYVYAQPQSVGIGTNTPHSTALLHVDLGTSTTNGFLVTGAFNGASSVPNLGPGSRLMFYPGKGAFRAGVSYGTGWDNSNVGLFSAAFGENNVASGQSSFAAGFGSQASAQSSIAMGYNAIANGQYCVSIGYNTVATFNNTTAFGYGTHAGGYATTAMGLGTSASGYAPTAMGVGTVAKGYASTVIGAYNDSLLLVDQGFGDPTSPLFIIGNGDSHNQRSNALVVRKSGKVGIGTNNPAFLLDVSGRMRIQSEGGSNTAGLWLNKGDNSGLGAFIGMYNDSYVGLYGGLGGWDFVMNTSTGNVGIGTLSPSQKLSVAGNICYTGSIAACSDIRYKKNIRPISHALTNLLTLHGIYYNWNKEKFSDKGFTDDRQIGFSAQEIEKLFPEMVQTDAEGYKSVDYSRMTPVLVEAIKEQQTQIELLKRKIEKLEKNSHRKIIKH